MTTAARISDSVSVYEVLRTRPAATAQLASLGLTRDMYGYRIKEAASALGVPVERLTAALDAPSSQP